MGRSALLSRRVLIPKSTVEVTFAVSRQLSGKCLRLPVDRVWGVNQTRPFLVSHRIQQNRNEENIVQYFFPTIIPMEMLRVTKIITISFYLLFQRDTRSQFNFKRTFTFRVYAIRVNVIEVRAYCKMEKKEETNCLNLTFFSAVTQGDLMGYENWKHENTHTHTARS